MNKTETLLLNGYFYKELFLDYKKKIIEILKDPSNYTIAIFYFKEKNNNYFMENQKKIFNQIGFKTLLINPENYEEFNYLINHFSKEKSILGINVELPLPKNYDLIHLAKIDIYKDIDCLNPINYHKFLLSKKENLEHTLIPSVAQAVLLMLQHYKIPFEKQDIVILGKSLYTGLAITHLLIKYNSTVQIINEDSKGVKEKCKQADIIISVTGKTNLIDEEYVTSKSVIIDVGFEIENGIIKGDVNIEKVKGIVKAVSIVPGGIGLLCNLSTVINLYKLLTLQKI